MRKKDKKYIRENIHKESIKEISEKLGLEERRIRDFLAREEIGERADDLPLNPENPASRPSALNHNLGVIFALLGAGLLVYSNTFLSSFQFDDRSSIVDNPSISHIYSLNNIWNFWPTRFITYLSLAVNYHLHQINVLGYHIFNLAVHVGSGILVWGLGLLTFSTPVMKDKKIARHARLISFFAGLVFITHPVQTEAVTYIIQRAASLAAFFTLASLVLYAASRLSEGSRRGRITYGGSLVSAVLAMFTKEVAITLPLLVCLYEFSFFKTKERSGPSAQTPPMGGGLCSGFRQKGGGKGTAGMPPGLPWRRTLPFLLFLSLIPLTMFFTKTINIEHLQRIGESAPSISAGRYLLTQFRVIVTYIRLLFVPLNQNFDYDYPIANTLLDLPVLASLFFLIGVLIVAVRLFRGHRLASFGIFFFFLALLPESSVVPINDVIFEHRLYLPIAGFSLFLTSGLVALFGKYNPRTMAAVFALLIIFNSALTYARNSVWKDELTLWSDTIRKSPHKARPYAGRGNAYGRKGDLDQAILDYNRAIENRPYYIEAYSNRGSAYAQKGDLDRALLDFSKAIEGKPDYADAYSNRGSVYAQKGDLGKAISDYSKVLEISPYCAEAYNGRGSAYARKGDLDRAILDCTKAIEIKPDYAGAYYNRGLAYRSKGDLDRAISDYSKVLEINPCSSEAYNGRGTAYAQKGDLERALLDCTKAIEIKPDYVEAYSNRAVMYFEKKEYAKSWEDVHQAQTLKYDVNPSFIEQLKKASGKEG